MESLAITLNEEHDIIVARNEVRRIAASLGFRQIDQTRLATVASELSRNIVKYAGHGKLIAHTVEGTRGRGLRLIFEDLGPGIADTNAAMRDGFTTGEGLGKGLPGSKRLMDEFDLTSELGIGTTVTVVKWS